MTRNRRDIAVCFFGITRSLGRTIPSIEARALAPARRQGSVKIFSHFFQQTEISNPRSGEAGTLDPEEHRLIPSDWLELEPPGECLETGGFEELKALGDSWEDDFRSLRNLVHQLHSIDRVTSAALDEGFETVIFLRPDLRYHDSLAYALRKALRSEGPDAWLPSWQAWGGVNDRFSICRGRTAIAAYGHRGRVALDYCRETGQPLQGEQLLAWTLRRNGVRLHDIDVCASRIRLDGSAAQNDVFSAAPRRFVAKWARRMGVKKHIKTGLARLRSS